MKRYFQIPFYWLCLLLLFFFVLSLMPFMAGSLVGLLTDAENGRDTLFRLGPFFPSLIYFLSSFALSAVISLALWITILLPLKNISRAARRVAGGDFDERVPVPRSLLEIRELTANFNRMVQELGSIESLRSDFVTTISHEFKTPLASIEGYATLLQDPALSPADRAEYTRIIIDSSRQLSAMAGNILLLSRLEKQEIVTNQKYFRLDEQIRQTILLLEPLWEKKSLELDILLPAARYYGNEEMLFHVWTNLLQNAIKFTPAGGMLSVSLTVSPREICVCVADTGIGMDEETRKRLFEKFFSKSAPGADKGNGLGLAITRRIIDLMHGSIEVESRPDEGSRFYVHLPVLDPAR